MHVFQRDKTASLFTVARREQCRYRPLVHVSPRALHICDSVIKLSRFVPTNLFAFSAVFNSSHNNMRACKRGVDFCRNIAVVICLHAIVGSDRLIGFRQPRMRVKVAHIRSIKFIFICKLTPCSLTLSSYRDHHTDSKQTQSGSDRSNLGYGVEVSLR